MRHIACPEDLVCGGSCSAALAYHSIEPRDQIHTHAMTMHEFEATQRILKKALTKTDNTARIKNVYLVVGEVAELDQNLILKHWNELSKGTPAEQAQLHFRLIKAEVQCMACFSKYQPLNGEIHCPYCGSYGARILSGEEFDLESIDVES